MRPPPCMIYRIRKLAPKLRLNLGHIDQMGFKNKYNYKGATVLKTKFELFLDRDGQNKFVHKKKNGEFFHCILIELFDLDFRKNISI